jgi:CubicO group peptidase (beta-lactamase class C family)
MSPRATHPDDARSITRNLRNLPVATPVRSTYIYCNIMYTVLSYLVEVKSKLGWSDFLDKYFFGPLDMQSTAYQLSGARAKNLEDRLAMSYYWDEEKSEYLSIYTAEDPEAQGAGGIFTSVNDFIKWVEALMNHPGVPINDNMYRGLLEMRTFSNPGSENLDPYTSTTFYTAGLEIYYYKGYAVVDHDGHDNGWGSYFFFVPDLHFGAVILGNSDGAYPLSAYLAKELLYEVIDAKSLERNTTDWQLAHALVLNRTEGKDKPPASTPLPLETPIGTYVGKYSNQGYHEMVVEIKDGSLFVNASDRSFGFTLTFEHIANQTEFIAHLSDWQEGGDDPLKAIFVFEGDHVVKMGLDLEPDLQGLIWFDKVTE